MRMFTQWLISTFLFGGTVFFAAGAPTLTGNEGAGDGGGDEAIDDGGLDSTADGIYEDAGTDGEDGQRSADEGIDSRNDEAAAQRNQERQREEPELKEFKGAASARVRGLLKAAPKLAEVFKESPQAQQMIEAAFRRDAAYRDAFPTVAEANQMRERFPNGLADVQALEADVLETQELDKSLYTRDREGNFPGHNKVIADIFQDNRDAAVSLFRALPKEWARLDPESYREVMGQIIGATFRAREIPEFIGDLLEDAKASKNDGLVQGLTKLLNWTNGFTAEKPRATPEQEQLKRERAEFSRQTETRNREEGQRFHRSFLSESRKLQTSIIKGHPAVKKLLENKTINEQKKQEMVEQVRVSIEKLLGKSTSFMRKLNPAYSSRDLQKVIELQKSAWSQQWLLNRMVRSVFNKEIPQVVSTNRDAVRRRTGAPAVRRPDRSGERKDAPTGSLPSKQLQGRWYRDGGRGEPFTTAEVLAGKHLA